VEAAVAVAAVPVVVVVVPVAAPAVHPSQCSTSEPAP